MSRGISNLESNINIVQNDWNNGGCSLEQSGLPSTGGNCLSRRAPSNFMGALEFQY